MKFKDIEKFRADYQKKYRKSFLISGGIAIGLVLIFGFSSGVPITSGLQGFTLLLMAAFFAFIVGLITASIATYKQGRFYHKLYKAYFVEQTLKKTFTSLIYHHDQGISKEYLKNTNMINTGDRFSSNDLTVGKYKNVKFVQADAHIQNQYTDSDGNTHYVTIFKGRFMVFEFPKKFSFKLELIGKRFPAARIPGKDAKTGRKMTKKSTESGEFNHAFRIYGQDDFESFYILDPAFMVKIMAIAERYKNSLLLGFLDNTLLVAVNDGKDSFEPPRFTKPLDEKTEMGKVEGDIKVITDFVDQLSLDKKLFK